MKRRGASIFVACVLAAALMLLLSVRSGRAGDPQSPQYLLIQPSYGGNGHFLPAQTYAYGWFGVAPRQKWTWHWDYYSNRWIWR